VFFFCRVASINLSVLIHGTIWIVLTNLHRYRLKADKVTMEYLMLHQWSGSIKNRKHYSKKDELLCTTNWNELW